MVRKLLRLSALIFIVLAPVKFPAYALDENLCVVTKDAIKQASEIRGLRVKRSVPCLLQNREEVKQYLLTTIKTKIPSEKLAMEGLVYRALGFIPPEFNYEEGLVKLYLDQLGGYYDPERDHFVMAAWMPAILQVPVAVHELTHALQDQHFNLDPFMDPKRYDGDQLMSRSALVEGDATAVMVDYTRRLMGQPGLSKEKDVSAIMLQNLLGTGMITATQDVPQSLVNMLIFPYTSGLRFVHSHMRKGGYQAVDRVYKNPPRSSEEILHPEKYPASANEFVSVADAPDIFGEGKQRPIVYRDTVGEFGISALLSSFVANKGECAKAASGWGGDRVVVYKQDADPNPAVVWRVHWDTEKDAKEFFEIYLQVISARSVRFSGEAQGHSVGVGLKDGSTMKMVLEGLDVTLGWREG